MLTPRTQAIKESLFAQERPIDLERALLYKESYEATEGEPVVVRRAKALRHLLDNHRIVIGEGERLLGNRTAVPRAGVVSPEMSPYWIEDELDQFGTRPQDRFAITDEDKATYREVLKPYWAGRSLNDWYRAHVAPEVVEAQRTKVFAVAQTDKGQGHIIPDFGLVIDEGWGAQLEKARAQLAENPNNAFLQAAVICLEAVISYYGRYVVECGRLAAEAREAGNEARAQELDEAAARMARLATEPARDFVGGLQQLWMTLLVLQHESNASSISLGRMDQYLWPLYQVSERELSADALREWIQEFYLKCNTVVFVRSTESAKFFAGFPSGFTITAGGIDAQGKDCSNELSELLLQVQHDTRLPQPNLSLRVHSLTPARLLTCAGDVIRLGDGMPQVFNDEANVLAFVNRGVSLEDARDYSVVGCVELSIPGRMYGLHDISMFNMVRCLEIALEENPEGFETFDGLVGAVEGVIDRMVKLMVEGCNTCDLAHRATAPTPLLSSLMDGAIERGRDITEGGAKYNPSGVQGVGTPNLADSLVVLKQAVIEQGLLDWDEMSAMLGRDWSGDGDEVWRQRFINQFPKYGNDIDEVDTLGARLLSHYGHEVVRYENPRGGHFQPGSYTVSAHIPLGEACGATPDGRHAHDQLADGGLSPMVGRDQHGPTASLRSVSKLDNIQDSNGSLLNVKFSPSTLAGDEGLNKLAAYLRAFCRLKIQHIQFNVVDKATLLDAQAHPENHKDLVVRVAGYSAMFTELAKGIQDDIINRSEHTL
ncbi:formate C-acetyltransferase/glycerol dehydratase family glycyl radical enzyme [Olsenella sp. YH-ols2217]|uniref:Formate C-acetyltransferase/glycerol dehydratase family glycyl radical enzyme n=1 Tax=Kribbibacterium absianum TaxID=3044210 RepID=A0ABT6ZJA0_9ACTN|nr:MULTISPECIES: formate C-acetyltransferase/glycerol dehydratase family glycyl radical enzyme [unclassified Olsenella]MDJ1122682.1 formate C-acetyltransferase/glycerol dehydratase family glycyl radical enzyme [Olsenella sp. YH-ols2216]MDJ1129120.1 formate C-acetyltransferase/glycerol dehydratase family glycyl radical enzyme [Olsenella sp. YH-ols2217]